jgi:hypothetical protein
MILLIHYCSNERLATEHLTPALVPCYTNPNPKARAAASICKASLQPYVSPRSVQVVQAAILLDMQAQDYGNQGPNFVSHHYW